MFAGKLVFAVIAAACVSLCQAQERSIDPTWLHRSTTTAPEKPSDITTPTCHYKPLFGQGDADTSIVVGVARYGEAIVDPHGTCATAQYPGEDQVYVVLSGKGSAEYGNHQVPLKTEDYLYIPSTVPHALKNESVKPMVAVIMGFRTKGFERVEPPKTPQKANIEDVPFEFVSGHPESSRFRLLMGDVDSKRDRIAAGRVLTSLFLMQIAPNGTNFPHHHEREEEIYLILSGHGTIVAGGGMDGIAGRHPAKPGDAYFFRLNATVGYYSAPGVTSRLLCVRSWYPGLVKKGMQH
ncbi:MAG TPA: cupin domain-containing protein [Acidobacteriaceae bacterium]|nr:cupin domain-containing protein [Acidobacteriaceae bacterium]